MGDTGNDILGFVSHKAVSDEFKLNRAQRRALAKKRRAQIRRGQKAWERQQRNEAQA